MQPEKPSFREAFLFWLKLGFISFGGAVGQIAIMHEFLVTRKKWISESKFMHALNYCMFLPGPEAQQLATYTGWLLHGTKGGVVAGIFFVLPSVILLLLLSALYVSSQQIGWLNSIFYGLKPAVVAIVILASWKISKKALKKPLYYVIALVIFCSIFFFKISFLLLMAITLLFALIQGIMFKSDEETTSFFDKSETIYYINAFTINESHVSIISIFKKVLIAVLLWVVPYVALLFLSHNFTFWNELIVFFTKTAFVTFGGAYAVLPYVAQVAVEDLNWLSATEMIDGLALGETTPGPLVMVLAFVGFMSGYNLFENSLLMGSAALLITTYYTFLPCFLFIFVGAPIIEKTRNNAVFKTVLSTITAAVVGLIVNLAFYLGGEVIVTQNQPDWLSVFWILVSIAVLQLGKVNMILWILVSAGFGFGTYFFLF